MQCIQFLFCQAPCLEFELLICECSHGDWLDFLAVCIPPLLHTNQAAVCQHLIVQLENFTDFKTSRCKQFNPCFGTWNCKLFDRYKRCTTSWSEQWFYVSPIKRTCQGALFRSIEVWRLFEKQPSFLVIHEQCECFLWTAQTMAPFLAPISSKASNRFFAAVKTHLIQSNQIFWLVAALQTSQLMTAETRQRSFVFLTSHKATMLWQKKICQTSSIYFTARILNQAPWLANAHIISRRKATLFCSGRNNIFVSRIQRVPLKHNLSMA